MEFHHIPVLFDEVMEWMQPRADGVYADGTLGGGGHSEGILHLSGGTATLYGIDRDEDAIRAASERLKIYPGFHAIHGNFHDAKALLTAAGAPPLTGALLDLGVSSHQLDEGDRGFSYHEDAPLDMRMDQSRDFTAKDLVNSYPEEKLYEIIKHYGEERYAKSIARNICRKRQEKEIETTGELVDIIKSSMPAKAKNGKGHPAKRTFQAIRIELNHELDVLQDALEDMVDLLNPGGRLCIITFHSLEDRIVKNFFRKMENPCTCPPDFPVCVCGKKPKGKVITRKPILPGEEELEINSRSKSAKLRIFERGE